jgi:hypothetical protein
MPKLGQAAPKRTLKYTAAEIKEKKERILELRGEAWSWKSVCQQADVSLRVFQKWRQQDESFAVACAAADGARRDGLVDDCLRMARDESTPAAQRAWMLMFLTKQADPSFRDNHKVEHVVSGGLAGVLKQLAKTGRSE